MPAPLVARGHRANFSTPRRVPVRALARLAGADVAQIVFSPTLPLPKGVPSAAHAMPPSAERATAPESTLNDAGQPGLGPVLPAAPTSKPTTRVFNAYPILSDVVNGAVLFVVPVELTAADSAMQGPDVDSVHPDRSAEQMPDPRPTFRAAASVETLLAVSADRRVM